MQATVGGSFSSMMGWGCMVSPIFLKWARSFLSVLDNIRERPKAKILLRRTISKKVFSPPAGYILDIQIHNQCAIGGVKKEALALLLGSSLLPQQDSDQWLLFIPQNAPKLRTCQSSRVPPKFLSITSLSLHQFPKCTM